MATEKLTFPLESVHRANGARFMTAFGYELPADYGDALAEQRLVAEAAGQIDQSYATILDLTGKDWREVLDRVFSSPVKGLELLQGQAGCLLSAKGKLVAAFRLYALTEERVRLVFDGPLPEASRKAIERYTFLADIEVAVPAEKPTVVAVQGPRAAEVLGAVFAEATLLPEEDVCVELPWSVGGLYAVRGGQTPEGGFELWVPEAVLEAVWLALLDATRSVGGDAIGQTAFDALRIEAGAPRRGQEYTEDSFPNEVGWERALTYDKCYVGQEIVARMRTYGQVHRRLKGLRLSCDASEAPKAALSSAGEAVGVVTSSAQSARLGPIALALVKRRFWDLTQVTVELPGGSVEGELVELPLVRI